MNREITLKNRMLKSVLTLLLSICMLATMGVATVFADDVEVPAEGEPVLSEEPEQISLDSANIEGIEGRYAYTGQAIKPALVVTMPEEIAAPEESSLLSSEAEAMVAEEEEVLPVEDEKTVLEEGVDYTIRYTNINGSAVSAPLYPGEYLVVVEGAGDYTGTMTIPMEVYMGEGWNYVDGNWYYYTGENTMLRNGWAKSGSNWCWVGNDGRIVRNRWIWTGGQWYYLKANGYRAANEWAKDSVGWMWMDGNGRIARPGWLLLNGEWYFIKSNGYMATNEWTLDSAGWMWMNGNGRITKGKWIIWGGSWYYLKPNGYMAANEWAMDSSRAYWMDGSGRLSYLKEGARYVWGAAGPYAFDCSGFTMYVMRQQGVYLPHSASGQYYALRSRNIGTNWYNAQPGDLVFYSYGGPGSSHHVGIYVGNGQVMHASSSHGRVVVTSINYSNGHIAAICRP